MLSRLPRNAPAWLDRLREWLEPFEVCFTHVAQRGAFRRYLLGLLSDSRRKSMSAMLERVSDPGTYQAFQHFITDAPWSAERVWRQLRAAIPARTTVRRTEGRARARSLQGALVSRLASPRRADRNGVRLAAGRTSARRPTPADPARRARVNHQDSHGAFLRDATALLTNHAKTRGSQSANLTK